MVELHLCGVDCSCAGSRQTRKQVNYFYVRAPEEYIEGSQTAWLGVTGMFAIIKNNLRIKISRLKLLTISKD